MGPLHIPVGRGGEPELDGLLSSPHRHTSFADPLDRPLTLRPSAGLQQGCNPPSPTRSSTVESTPGLSFGRDLPGGGPGASASA